MKIVIVTSPGGHLYQAYLLKQWWSRYDRIWITLRSPDVRELLKGERIIYGYGPTYRSPMIILLNFALAFLVVLKEKPDIIFSPGAGIAPPFLWLGKLFNVKTVFLEPYDFFQEPSLSGRLVSLSTDVYLVQHKQLLSKVRRSKFWGSII